MLNISTGAASRYGSGSGNTKTARLRLNLTAACDGHSYETRHMFPQLNKMPPMHAACFRGRLKNLNCIFTVHFYRLLKLFKAFPKIGRIEQT
jgi:hypothetical protein